MYTGFVVSHDTPPTCLHQRGPESLFQSAGFMAALWPRALCSYSQEGTTQCGDFPRRSVSRVIVISPESGWLHPLAWLVISGPHLLPPPRGAGGGRPQGSARILSRAPSPYHRAEMSQTPSASAEPPDWKVNPDSRHLACLFSPPRDHYLPTRSFCPSFCLRV